MQTKVKDLITKNIDVLILCGGKGTRFEEVSNSKPKALADIQGKPLIDIIINTLERNGFSRFILAVGYRNEHIVNHFEGTDRDIIISKEKELLGTGGAIKFAERHINSNLFMVMNGDLICDMNHEELVKSHIQNDKFATLAVSVSDSNEDYGNISIGPNNSIEEFIEKSKNKETNFVSAGTYIMEKSIFNLLPEEKVFSIERDFFEKNPDKLNAHVIEESFLDIGTPERYRKANNQPLSD